MAVIQLRWRWLFFILFILIMPANAFVLEGSPTSYAQFKRWYAGITDSLSFEFRTTEPNGLLIYLDDGGVSDFFELKLVDGIIRFRFNLGGGAMLTHAGKNLHDDNWHRLELIRNIEDTILRIDEDTQSKVTKGTDYQFGNYSVNSFVYIGGIPSWYSAKVTQLSLPSVFFEPHFKGSIRNVVYASEEGPHRHQDMIEFKGIRSNDLDACKHHDPCLHGGVCVSTDSGAICDCGTGDYDGNFCEKERTPAEATFRGSEYLSYDLQAMNSEAILSSSDQVSLYFKSRQPSGLLFYTGKTEDHLLIALKDGGITLIIHLGSSTVEKVLKPAKVRFDDNQWHKVLVHRKVREITRATSFCHFSITVDGVYTERGSTAGTFNLLSSSVLYVGGSDQSATGHQGARQHSNLVGCIKKVEFVADSLKMEIIELGRTSNKLIHQQGNVQYLCQEVEAADPITFTNKESFLALPSWDAARTGSIAFKIRTNEANGVLMYNTGATAQGDFFAFELLDGHVFLLLNLGSGAVKVKATTRRVDDGQWHSVALRRTGKSGRVTVDESAVDFITPGNSNQLDLEGPLYIGGVGTSAQGVLIPSELWSGSLRYGYVGCMRDLVINGRAVDIAGVSQKQDSGSIRPACHTSTPQCDSQPCLNGGLCLEGWNHFTCDCSHTSFSGTVCAKDATTLSFDGTEYMRITMAEGPTQAEDIRLRMKTTRPSGLLFTTVSEKSTTHLSAALEAGRMKLVLNLGDGNKVFFVGQGLNDDQWHTLHVTRRGQSMDVKVDTEATSRELSGQNINLDFQTLYIGSTGSEKPPPSLTSTTTANKEVPNFVGHMQHFIFNGQHFFDMARSGQMTNFKVTAKFGKKDEIVHHPVTFKSKITFIGLSQLKAYSSMNLYFQFKTLEPNGLILYNGGKGQDFIAIELVDGHLHYIFNLGDGPRKVRSNTRTTLNDNHWHAVTIGRPSVKQHTLMVDDMIATVGSTGSNVHLDLDGLLYLGGVRRASYAALPKLVQSRYGFEGCLASLDLNGETVDPIRDAVVPSTLVSPGCAGPVTKCSTSACANRGICVQMWNSYTCDCDMTSYTGPTCSDESISYKFGQKGGLITFSFPSDKRPDTKSDLLALGFISSTDNAVLVRIDSGSSNDYMELEIVDGNVFMVYNMGTEDHPIGELSVNVNDHQYHVVRFTRSGPNSTIQIDDHNVRTKQPTGRQHTIFNSHSKIQVGGKFNPIKNMIERPFQGVISGLVFGGNRILDMGAEDDPRVSVQGDVELLITIPPGGQTAVPTADSEERPSTPDPVEPTEEMVFSGAGSGCWDDEDDCETANNEKHGELITPEFVTPTPEDLGAAHREDACEDDDDCFDIGSGISAGENNRPDETLLTIPTYHPPPPESGFPPMPPSNIPPIVIHNVPTDQQNPKTTRVPAVVYEVPIPGPSGKDYQRPTQRTRSSADNTALVIGVIAGILIAIVLVALIVYKLRNRTEGSYKVDESKNYQFAASIAASPAFLNGPPPHLNGLSKGHPEKTPKKKKSGKDLKEWYV